MSRLKTTPEQKEKRKKLAQKLKEFMVNNKFTEKRLGEICGLSRRSVQMVKAGRVTPQPESLRKLETLFLRYKQEGK